MTDGTMVPLGSSRLLAGPPAQTDLGRVCVTSRRTLSLTARLASRTLAARPRAPPRWRARTWEVGGPSTVLLTQV